MWGRGGAKVFWKFCTTGVTTPNIGVWHFCRIKTVELANICLTFSFCGQSLSQYTLIVYWVHNFLKVCLFKSLATGLLMEWPSNTKPSLKHLLIHTSMLRRTRAKLTMAYKILNGQLAMLYSHVTFYQVPTWTIGQLEAVIKFQLVHIINSVSHIQPSTTQQKLFSTLCPNSGTSM